MRLLGVVLCGGKSKRMGSDKGLLPVHATTWAQHAADKLQKLDIPVVISVNEAQCRFYEKIFPAEKLVVDRVKAKGPLNGLLSVHDVYPDNDLLLMACDMTDMDHTTLSNLKDVYIRNPSFDFYVHKSGGFIEPFCAIYPSASLKKIRNELYTNRLPSFSLYKLIGTSDFKQIQILDKTRFSNYNTPTPSITEIKKES